MTQRLQFMQGKSRTVFVFMFLLMSGCLFASPQQQYRTQASGDWNTASNWQSSSNGTTWVTASFAPTSANASSVTVSNAMIISATISSTTGSFTINSGASVTIDSLGFITLGNAVTNNGTITIQGAGGINCGANVISGTGSFTLNSRGSLYSGNANGIASSGSTGNIQTTTRSFSSGANYYYNGSVAQSTGTGLPTGTITGNITVTNTSALGLTLTNNVVENGTFSVGSGYTLNCGTNVISGSGGFTLSSGGTIIIGSTAGITSSGATGNIQTTTRSFSAGANYNYTSTAVQAMGTGLPATLTGNLTINNTNTTSGATLGEYLVVNSPGVFTVNGVFTALNYQITGTGSFTLAAGATLMTNHTSGISSSGATGTVQTTTRSFSASANYVFESLSAQICGNGLPTTVNNLTINDGSGVSLSNNVTVNGTLTLFNGTFCLNAHTLTIASGATISTQTGSISTACRAGSTFTFAGTVNLTYTGTSSITTGMEMPSTSSALGTLTINNNVGIKLSSNITINTQLILTKGNINLNGYTLTYATGSSLMYNGTSASQTVTDVEWPVTFDKNVYIANSYIPGAIVNGGVILNDNKTGYTGALTINSGGALNVSTYYVGGSGTFTQSTNGTFITGWTTGVVPTAGIQLSGTVSYSAGGNFIFDGTSAQVTGTGMPATVNALTIANSSGVTLTQSTENTAAYSTTPYNSLILYSGALSIGANTLSIDGVISTSSGTLTGGSSSYVYFNGSNLATTLPAVSGGLSVLAINRSNAIISIGANLTINDTLDMWTGTMNWGSFTITLGGIINEISGSILGGTSSNFSISNNANTVYIPNITNGLNNLSINRSSSGAALAANLTLAGTLTLNSGVFSIAANTLTTSGTLSIGTGSMAGGPASSLVVIGNPGVFNLPAVANGLDNVTVNRSSSGLTMTGNNVISGLLTLSTGNFNIGAHTLELDSAVSIAAGFLKGGGTSNITIGGTMAPFYMPLVTFGLHNLVVNDPNHIALTSNLVVSNSIALSSGGIYLNQYNLSLNTANGISGAGSNWIMSNSAPGTNGSFVQNVGSTAVLYPVGTAASYTPVTITNSGTADSFYVNVLDGVYTHGKSGTTLNSIELAVNKTWVVSERTAGHGNATLKVQWNTGDENAHFDETASGISGYLNGSWDNASETAFDNTTNPGIVTLTRTGIDSFHAFGVGKKLSPLPVELLYFKGLLADKTVNLAWATATEINNDHFTIERSADGQNFYELANVKGAGNSVTVQNYSYDDKEPLTGISYYRLKQTDINGTSVYTGNVVEINNGGANSLKQLNMEPNPFKGNLKVNFATADKGSMQVTVSDLSGKTVYTETATYIQGSNALNLNLDNLTDGIYILKMQMGNTVNTQRIVKSTR